MAHSLVLHASLKTDKPARVVESNLHRIRRQLRASGLPRAGHFNISGGPGETEITYSWLAHRPRDFIHPERSQAEATTVLLGYSAVAHTPDPLDNA